MEKLQFKYTKRARLQHPIECGYAQKVIRKALPVAVEYFKLPWKKVVVTIDTLDVEDGKITLGAAEVVDGEYRVIINCNKIRSEEDYVTTFGHELTHLCQYHQRRLRGARAEGFVIWNGIMMPHYSESGGKHFDEYYDSPWEIEAREEGDKFYAFFKKERRKKTWWGRLLLKLRLHAL